MGNLFNSLNKLKTNIFGGPGNTGKTAPPASRVAKLGIKNTPTSKLEVDPMSFASFSYPRDVTNNVNSGHYMLFYVNVQNRSKFQYTNPYGTSLSTTKQTSPLCQFICRKGVFTLHQTVGKGFTIIHRTVVGGFGSFTHVKA